MATIAERLRDAPVGRTDYLDYLREVLDDTDDSEVDDTTFAEAFHFIERNAHADLGTPGPLVHFLERFYPRYLSRLVESVRRRPTSSTVWMLNRILNGSPSKGERSEFLEILASVAANPGADADVQRQARRFWERHAQAG